MPTTLEPTQAAGHESSAHDVRDADAHPQRRSKLLKLVVSVALLDGERCEWAVRTHGGAEAVDVSHTVHIERAETELGRLVLSR